MEPILQLMFPPPEYGKLTADTIKALNSQNAFKRNDSDIIYGASPHTVFFLIVLER